MKIKGFFKGLFKTKPCVHGFTENEVIGAAHKKTLPRCHYCGEPVDVLAYKKGE